MTDTLTPCPYLPVFQNEALSTNTGFSSSSVSAAQEVLGNCVAVSAILRTITSGSVTVALESSSDGRIWKDTGVSLPLAAPAPRIAIGAATAVAYPFMRLRAVLTGASATAVFDASVTFSTI